AAPPGFAGSPWENALAALCEHAPYLRRLVERRPDLLANPDARWPERLLAEALAAAAALAAEPAPIEAAMRTLRRAKDALHLAAAVADLSRAWPLQRITGALTDFADAALGASLAVAVRERIASGDIVAVDGANGPAPGLALIAMGKMGARALNYSSDIDVSVCFAPEALAVAEAREPRVAAVRLVAPLVRMLEEVTEDGYVFR